MTNLDAIYWVSVLQKISGVCITICLFSCIIAMCLVFAHLIDDIGKLSHIIIIVISSVVITIYSCSICIMIPEKEILDKMVEQGVYESIIAVSGHIKDAVIATTCVAVSIGIIILSIMAVFFIINRHSNHNK